MKALTGKLSGNQDCFPYIYISEFVVNRCFLTKNDFTDGNCRGEHSKKLALHSEMLLLIWWSERRWLWRSGKHASSQWPLRKDFTTAVLNLLLKHQPISTDQTWWATPIKYIWLVSNWLGFCVHISQPSVHFHKIRRHFDTKKAHHWGLEVSPGLFQYLAILEYFQKQLFKRFFTVQVKPYFFWSLRHSRSFRHSRFEAQGIPAGHGLQSASMRHWRVHQPRLARPRFGRSKRKQVVVPGSHLPKSF